MVRPHPRSSLRSEEDLTHILPLFPPLLELVEVNARRTLRASRTLGRFRVAFGRHFLDERVVQPLHLFLHAEYMEWQRRSFADREPSGPGAALDAQVRQLATVSRQLENLEVLLLRMEYSYIQALRSAEQALLDRRYAVLAAHRARDADRLASERAALQSDRYHIWLAQWTGFQLRTRALGTGPPRVGLYAPPPPPLRFHLRASPGSAPPPHTEGILRPSILRPPSALPPRTAPARTSPLPPRQTPPPHRPPGARRCPGAGPRGPPLPTPSAHLPPGSRPFPKAMPRAQPSRTPPQ